MSTPRIITNTSRTGSSDRASDTASVTATSAAGSMKTSRSSAASSAASKVHPDQPTPIVQPSNLPGSCDPTAGHNEVVMFTHKAASDERPVSPLPSILKATAVTRSTERQAAATASNINLPTTATISNTLHSQGAAVMTGPSTGMQLSSNAPYSNHPDVQAMQAMSQPHVPLRSAPPPLIDPSPSQPVQSAPYSLWGCCNTYVTEPVQREGRDRLDEQRMPAVPAVISIARPGGKLLANMHTRELMRDMIREVRTHSFLCRVVFKNYPVQE